MLQTAKDDCESGGGSGGLADRRVGGGTRRERVNGCHV